MRAFQIKTPSQQVAAYLREQIRSGHYQRLMPGMDAVARELGVDPKTVGLAMELLEKEGILVSQGVGRARRIAMRGGLRQRVLNLKILCYEARDRRLYHITEMVHQLIEQGFEVQFAKGCLTEMQFDIGRISRLVEQTPADAWVVLAGSSEVLEWFSRQSFPSYAVFGRQESLEIAGVSIRTPDVYREAVRRLIALGHRKIVFLTRRERRKPTLGLSEQAFLEELELNGIKTGPYNLPEWEESIDGLHGCLDALMALTPPTAMIVSQPELFMAAYPHLLRRGFRVPEEISLICSGFDSSMSWCNPPISRLQAEPERIIQHVVHWATAVAGGRSDRKKSSIKARFVEGGTIGPVPGQR